MASHRQGSHLEAIEKFFAENGNAGAFTQEELLLFFKGWLKREIRRGHTRVKRYFPVHNNAVGCKANVPDPELNDDQYLHDLKTDRCGFYRECGLKKYIAEHVSDFINLREVLLKVKPADSETKKRIQSLKKLYRIRDRDFSRSDCFRCGDALIAHECSDKEFLATTNAKHFKDICHSFTKPLLTVNLNLASKPESA
ncbi:MAG TPA: hypothetical protein VHC95_04845 [Opitutales bacterium]|nr:hypothetical protein [Opitutales bacterium]